MTPPKTEGVEPQDDPTRLDEVRPTTGDLVKIREDAIDTRGLNSTESFRIVEDAGEGSAVGATGAKRTYLLKSNDPGDENTYGWFAENEVWREGDEEGDRSSSLPTQIEEVVNMLQAKSTKQSCRILRNEVLILRLILRDVAGIAEDVRVDSARGTGLGKDLLRYIRDSNIPNGCMSHYASRVGVTIPAVVREINNALATADGQSTTRVKRAVRKPSGGARPKSRSKLKRHKQKSRHIKGKSRRRKSKRKSRRRHK